jgi:Sulfotransferase family
MGICENIHTMGQPSGMDSRSSKPGSPPHAQSERPKVVYVMGAGRSGSTILGVTLGNCEGVFYAGELDKWLPRAGVSPMHGEARARFWSVVRGELDDAADLFGGEVRQLERSSALFRSEGRRTRRRLRARYRRVAEELYQTVARAAGATHVVDTSHYPLRARELQAVDGIELYLVLLVRNPHSVVASFSRDDVPERRFNMPTTNAYLWLTYLLSILVFLRHPRERRLLLRHEDFVADPEGVLREILDRVGSRAAIPDLTALRTGVPFQANRMVMSEVVALDGRVAAQAPRSRMTTLVQLPVAAALSRLRPAASVSSPREHLDQE